MNGVNPVMLKNARLSGKKFEPRSTFTNIVITGQPLTAQEHIPGVFMQVFNVK